MTPNVNSQTHINGTVSPTATKEGKDAKAKRKLTPEQREKIEAIERERREKMKIRVDELSVKLIERLRPFVDGTHEGELQTWEAKIKTEAEDLKLESFGVELLHTIGSVYVMKATSYLKSKKLLGIPGFFSRLKEKWTFAKDVLGVIGSAVSVQSVMQDLERAQLKGDVPEEELKALEMDVTGKILLASWRGTRFEVVSVLREVCEKVLKDKSVAESVLTQRAKGMLFIGAIFKATVPDETDAERRELERIVAEAALPKKKHVKKSSPSPPVVKA